MTTTSRWAPTLGANVRFKTPADRAPDEEPLPSGIWKLISRNDRGPQHWWALASDNDARAWAAVHPGVVVSGCIDADGQLLTPVNGIRI